MDENQNPARTQPTPIYQYPVLWGSVLLLFTSIIVFWIAPSGYIYWLRETYLVLGSSFLNISKPFGLCLTLLIIGSMGIIGIRNLIVQGENRKVRITIITLIILTVLITLAGLLIGIFIFLFGGPERLSSATLMDNRYHLESSKGPDYIYYDLFKCNYFDFACENVWDIQLREELGSTDVYLIADPETNALLIMDDGETIYTYAPQ